MADEEEQTEENAEKADTRDEEIATLKAAKIALETKLLETNAKLTESNNIIKTVAGHKKQSREIETILKEYL